MIQNEPVSDQNRKFLRNSVCAANDGNHYICCANDGETSINQKPKWLESLEARLPKDCGLDIRNRIFGGGTTEVNEFPWTVLLQSKSSE